MKKNSKQAGFSLFEIGVLMVVVGVIGGLSMSSGLTMKKVYDVKTSKNQLESIQVALELFRDKQGRYPCPAPENDIVSSATYGVEGASCADSVISGITKTGNAAIGMVPYKTLGINKPVVIDQWGNKITYAIDMAHTISSTVGPGSLTVNDAAGNSLTQSPVMGKALYVIISHGEDGNGAYPEDSSTKNTCGATAKDIENCDNDAVFVDDKASQSTLNSNYYDDYVLWKVQSKTKDEKASFQNKYVNKLQAGDSYVCALTLDKAYYCFGNNTYGTYGDGTTTPSYFARYAQDASTWTYLTSNRNFNASSQAEATCVIKIDGSLWCWGRNNVGNVGNGTTAIQTVPYQIAGSWKKVEAANVTCAIKSDDTLWCWGGNYYGGVGNGTTVNQLTPVQIGGASTWKDVATRQDITCGIKTDDTLWCWGLNALGAVGDGTTTNRLSPVAVSGGGTWKSVYMKVTSTCGIKTDDTLWCWGSNFNNVLGDGTSTNRTVPTQVSGGGRWKMVTSGTDSMCGIKLDATLWCWGAGGVGQLGNGSWSASAVPLQISGEWLTVVGSATNATPTDHYCAIKSDDTLWCWGRNIAGDLGNGTATGNKNTPTQVHGGGQWRDVYIYNSGLTMTYTACGIKKDNTLWCWGSSGVFSFGVGTRRVTSSMPMPVVFQ